MKKKRIFFGFPIDKILTGKLIDFKEKIVQNRNYNIEYKWVKAENYHLTLLFVGSVFEDEIALICNKAEKILAKVSDFNLKQVHFIAFPTRKPKMIWLKFEHSHTFENIVLDFRKSFLESDKLSQAIPHITLARIKRGSMKEQMWGINDKVNLQCNTVHLYESELTPDGPIYTILKTFDLNIKPI